MIRTTARITLFILSIGLVLSVLSAQDDSAIVFDFVEDSIVQHGLSGDWDSRHTSAGAVIYHEGQFHMFRNGYQAWPLPSQFGYMVSDDGINWEDVQEEPVFYHDGIPFDVKLALLNAAIAEEDGSWTFYFSLWPENDTARPSGIVRATADSPTGTWEMDDTIVLEPGEGDAWDAGFIGISSVLKVDDEYLMYYGGNDGDNWAVGRAVSEDGITWEKDPEPILTKLHDWEDAIQDPRVVHTGEQFVMLYNSGEGNYNFAVSEDGITWERVQDEPVIPRSLFERTPWIPTLTYHDGTFFAYFERDVLRGTDIFVATYEGEFTIE